MRHAPLLALLIGVATTGGCQCECSSPELVQDSTSQLIESQSIARTAAYADSGYSVVDWPEFQDQPIAEVTVYMAESLDDGGDCITIVNDLNDLTVSMNCPADAGLFGLPDLRATACDDVACASLAGTMNVQAFKPECGYGCGLLAATLDLPEVFDGGGPFVSGSAALSYHYVNSSYACTGPLDND